MIDHFGADLLFTYPRDKKKSQMNLSRIQIEDVIGIICAKDPIEMCAKKVRSECQEFEVGPDKGFRYASDLQYTMEKLESTDSLQHWNSFLDIMFPTHYSTVAIKKKGRAYFSNCPQSDS